MTELAKDAIDKLDALLRNIAPGFVLLVTLILIDTNQRLGVVGLFRENWWNGFGIGALLGLTSYALHIAIFEDWWMLPVWRVVKYKYRNDIPSFLLTEKTRELIPILTRERCARTVAGEKKTVAIQMFLTKAYAWLIFLYCSGYLLLGGSAVLLFKGTDGFGFRVWMMVAGGVLALASAMIMDCKVTRHELWLIKTDRQFT